MAFYVGGDTTELEYDFYTKTAGSTVTCPIKLYKGEVDPAALPSPTDTLWKEVTSQSVIDKLKEQNEITTSNLAIDKSTIMWGDKTLTKTATVKVTDDFVGTNPNEALVSTGDGKVRFDLEGTTLKNEVVNGNFASESNVGLGNCTKSISNNTLTLTGTGALNYYYSLHNSTIPVTEGRKIYSRMTITPLHTCESILIQAKGTTGGAVNPLSVPVANPTVGTPYLLSKIYTVPTGFTGNWVLYSTATYADSATANGKSIKIQDVICLDLTALGLENKIVEELDAMTQTYFDGIKSTADVDKIISTDFMGKVSGSLVENGNVSKYKVATSLQTPTGFTSEFSATDYSKLTSLDNNLFGAGIATSVSTYVPQTLFSFNIVTETERKWGREIPTTNGTLAEKVQWCKDNIKKLVYSWHGYGSCPSGNKAQIGLWNGSWSTSIAEGAWSTTSSTVKLIQNSQSSASPYIMADGFTHLLAYTDASDGVTASTIYTDYVSLAIEMKPTVDVVNKIEVLSRGKNLFDGEFLYKYKIDPNGNLVTTTDASYVSKKYLVVKPNTNYIVSHPYSYYLIGEYDINKNPIKRSDNLTGFFTTSPTTYHCLIYFYVPVTNPATENIQLEEGTTATTYEPYKSNKIDILPTLPLRSLPNGVRDNLNSGGTVTRRIGKVVLDGSESWSTAGDGLQIDTIAFYKSMPTMKSYSSTIIDRFKYVTGSQVSSNDSEAYYVNNNIIIWVLRSKLATQDVAGFKAWLASNPTTVYYELATPTTETITTTLVDGYSKGSVMVDSGGISGNFILRNYLLSPSDVNWQTTSKTNLETLNGTTLNVTSDVYGATVQKLLKFNLINIFEQKYGSIPKETVAEKVEWLKSNLKMITCKTYIYGNCPTGNKAYIKYWDGTLSWLGSYSNTVNTPTLLTSYPDPTNIDSNGFVHFLTYTDASNGTTPSTIYSDYCSIELTLKAPENLITASNTLDDIVTDFTGKVSGSTVANGNVFKFSNGNTSLMTPSSFTYEANAEQYYNIKILNDGVKQSASTSTNGAIPQKLFSFNIVSAVEKHLGQPIPAVDKVQWCKDNVNKVVCDWYGYGSCPSGYVANLKLYQASISDWNGVVYSNTANAPTLINWTPTTPSLFIDSNGMVHALVYTGASDGVTPSTIFTDYVKLTIELKYIPTYDFYTDSNNRRDAGLTNIVLVKRSIGDMTSDFTGKVSGSVVENPNISKGVYNSTLQTPSSFISEVSNVSYSYMNSINATCGVTSTSTNGQIAQRLFSFNLIAIAEKQLGTSIPGADTASKVQWCKDNINRFTIEYTGYGSCPTGNKAYVAFYKNDTSLWNTAPTTITSSTPTTITLTGAVGYANWRIDNLVDANGFAHFLAYTDASDGVTASVISTDYVKITLTFKTDTVGVEYFTNNSSEISVTTNNKASAQMIILDTTPLCSALVGGSNSALKTLIKNYSSVDFYAIGSGSYVNQLGYGITLKSWNGTSWVTLGSNANQNIQKTTSVFSNAYLTSDNKIYFLLHSNYKSDGVIGSEISIDYIGIKLLLNRTPDIISPIQITI